MKNFESIGIDTSKIISREKLINLKGGNPVPECYHITCIGFVGEWYGMYDSFVSAVHAGGNWCESASIEIEPSSAPECDLIN
ncbi:MAG: hypothetical protein U5K32_11195 [Bacteroidales bacterium]|nr:hypothetical protein [Bacteroidales bacterium]